ncbi:unnamed protein product [Alternaria alternata]
MSFSSNRVAVIGAGISGVVAAAHLKKEGIEVVVFERSSAAGGIWRYDKRKPLEPSYSSAKRSRVDSVHASEDLEDVESLLHAPPGVSATDIARELSPYANKIIQSQRNGKFDLPPSMLPDNAYRVDEIVSYDEPRVNTLASLKETQPIPATVTLKSGAKICDIHHVILCTGYHLTLPFLSQLTSDETPVDQADDTLLVTDGTQFHNLHKDIFFINDPTLAFVGVPFFTATFTLFEFQAMVVAKVLSGQAKLPSKDAMRLEYNARVETKGYGKAFHSLRDQEASYVKELIAWVNSDLEKAGKERLRGHSDKWHSAKAEQMERMKAFFANPGIERRLEATCL